MPTIRKLPVPKKRNFEHRLAHTREDIAALQNFATALKTLRCEFGYTQATFAKAVECSAKNISHIELGESWPSMSVYLRICKVLKQPKPPMI